MTTDSQSTEKPTAQYAFERAVETRNFEIGLFWTRAGYFWLFVAADLAAYGVLWTQPKVEAPRMLLAILGLVFSFAWWLANRGNKWWFERWESKVEALEEAAVGDTVLFRSEGFQTEKKNILGAARFSVSQIAIDVSAIMTVVWLTFLVLEVLGTEVVNMTDERVRWGGLGVAMIGCLVLYVRSRRSEATSKAK